MARSGVNWKCSRPGQERYIAFDQKIFLSKWWWPSCNLSTQELTCPEPYPAIFFYFLNFHLVVDIDHYILYALLCLSDSESCEVSTALQAPWSVRWILCAAFFEAMPWMPSFGFGWQFWQWNWEEKTTKQSLVLSLRSIGGWPGCFLSIDHHWLTWKFYHPILPTKNQPNYY